MAKRKTKKKAARRTDVENAADRLRKALAKQTKPILLDLLMGFATSDKSIMRGLEGRFDIETPTADLVAATRQAIVEATDFDERKMNHNFDYDYGAYEAVQQNFKRLVGMEYFAEAMELSLELMKQGSYQVEMSDEGMMTDDIEGCLSVVVKGLKKSGLPAKKLVSWCNEMNASDRVGFLCEVELDELREK